MPVVFHDANLRRTANRREAIRNLNSTELGSIDVGSWFNHKHPRRAKTEYANERIPTLEQVLSLVASNVPSDFACYLELKIDRRENDYRDLAESVLSSIETHKLSHQTTIVSFNLAALAYVKQRNPSIRTGALFEPRTLTANRKRTVLDRALECGAAEILLHRLRARPAIVELALRSNLAPVVWTVDDCRWIARAERLGIHALITNKPANFLAQMKSESV